MNKIKGLTLEEVEDRIKNKQVNKKIGVKTPSIMNIIIKNIFTPFNLLNLFLASLLFWIGEYKNLLFLGVVVINTIISSVQEISAKKITDKLSILDDKKIKCIRNNKEIEISSEKLVIDDVIKLVNNDVIPADCKILSGEVEVNESLLTGEEDVVIKKSGDTLLSGSFIISGEVVAQIFHVGIDNYANKIVIDSKYIKKNQSQIVKSLNKIIKIMAIVIIPLGLLLFRSQYNISNDLTSSLTNTIAAIIIIPIGLLLFFKEYNLDKDLSSSIINTVAAVIGMIPEGLILLTSTVFALGVIRLSKYNVLIKNLYSIENLSRVDTVCLDKTGTLTYGDLKFSKIIYINENTKNVDKMLNIFISNSINMNKTTLAIQKKYNKTIKEEVIKRYNFSSDRKYSALSIKNYGTILLGAPEKLCKDKKTLDIVNKYSDKYRCLLLGYTNQNIDNNFDNIEVMAIIMLEDRLRDNIENIVKYLYKENVNIKIITGDSKETASKIAKKCGIKDYDKAIDISNIYDRSKLEEITNNYTIFARSNPFQKKDIIKYLKKNSKVAYIGDGTNDVMALKESDFSISFDNASDDAKNVSDAILMNSSFETIPKIIAEGRREINNMERSASLFLVKTMYSLLLTVIFLFIDMSYPFIPIQLTLISALTIGIPSFVLALERTNKKVEGYFLTKIIKRALAPALTIVINVLIISAISNILNLSYLLTSTMCVVLTSLTCFIYLYNLCIPFDKLRSIMYGMLASIFVICVLFFKNLFSLSYIPFNILVILLILFILSTIIYNIINILVDKSFKQITK